MKKLLIISFAFTLTMLMAVPASVSARAAVEIIDNDYQEISVSVNASTLHVVGASGQTLYIYNVAGVRVLTIKVDGSDRHYEVNLPKGCYIVKVGKTVRKISIR